MKWRLMTPTIVALVALIAPAAAQEATKSKEVEELQRQVRALEARVHALTTAVTEMAELTQRSATIWSRALAGEARPVEEAPAKAKAKPRTTAPAAAARPAAVSELGVVRGRVTVPKGEPIAYVYVENVFAAPVRGKTVVIDQKNKAFAPGWAVVRRGTTVSFPNHDNIYHNVFSHSPGNAFDLGLYNSAEPAKSHSFQSAGSVDIYCNIHPAMSASVLVVPNDHFAKVQPDGTFVINDVPVGQRKIVAWSPGTAPATQWVELKAGAGADVQLVLETRSRMHKNKEGRAYGSYQ
jgi:plastocyanin